MRNQHQHLHDMVKRDVTTIDGSVVSVVYVTASPTFTGVIGGYTTTDEGSSPSSAVESAAPSVQTTATPIQQTASSSKDPFSYDTSTFTGYTTPTSSAVASSAAVSSNATPVLSSSSSAAYAYSTNQSSPTGTSSTSSDASTSSSSASTSGMSTAGKAGLAVGIILVIGAVLALVLFLLGKKKKQVKAEQAREDSEKNASIARERPSNAPRLSLRPGSSFLPEFMGGARPKSRLSQNGMLGGPSSETNATREKYLAAPTQAQQSIPMTEKSAPAENPFKDPENPFADHAHPAAQQPAPEPVRMPEPVRKEAALPMPTPMPAPAPAPAPLAMPEPITNSSDKIAVAAASAGAVAAAQAAMRNGEAPRSQQNRPEPVEMPSPPIGVPAPLATPKSMNSNAGPGTPDGQVYRILMDFVPSMEDELELKGGQVVRMLHEYDDGWVS